MARAAPPEDHLEYHIYLDPPAPDGDLAGASAEQALSRCCAAHVAITSRLEPRLRAHVWDREPFRLWVWDPAERRASLARSADACLASEPHLWGRIEVGDAVHDEWLVVGLLLRLSAEHPDAAITVRNSAEGELLLVEASYCLPHWVSPDNSANRVFLRRGAMHLLSQPKPKSGAEEGGLSVDTALRVLRASGCSASEPPPAKPKPGAASAAGTAHAAATAAVRRRIAVSCDGADGFPLRHAASALLPLRAARLLQHSPELLAAAVLAFEGRQPEAMTAAAALPAVYNRREPLATIKLSFSRPMYARVVGQRFAAPPASGLRAAAAAHSRLHAPQANVGAQAALVR